MVQLAEKKQQNINDVMNHSAGEMVSQEKHSSADISFQPSKRLSTVKVKRSELVLFTTQLAVMLDSGVVLSDALDAIAMQSEQGTFKMIVTDIAETVKSGESFSRLLSAYPKVFDPMFISMVKASEASGRMPEMLRVLSGYLDFEDETRKSIKAALTYPLIMASMAVVATSTLMFFVLPRFTKIYEAKSAALPKITQLLVSFSALLTDFDAMTKILTTIILAAMAFYYWMGTPNGRRAMDFVKIHTPVLGAIFVDTAITRSMRIMATMVNTGVSLLDTIEIMRGSCENYYFQRLWTGTDEKIRDGYQLSESMRISPGSELIAPGIIQMLQAGEKSGKIGEVSDKISTFYEKKLACSIKSVTTLLEPLMITILGAIIGTIAIALLLPVFKISSVVAH
ncbi:MAG: type II secretion system F family protein [Planctomycetes bacterium]|nr:type II secretion system F family protein [Planctomycetota bacterium]